MASDFFVSYGGGGSGGGGGTGNSIVIDTFTLNASDITNKGVILSKIPTAPAKVVVIIADAPGQEYNVDYTVDSNLAPNQTLDWTGLALEGVLTVGDVLEVIYY
jgi:hypothetical protein